MNLPAIYLASASPRRHEILVRMGVEHEVLHVPAPEGEDEPRLPGEPPEDYVRRTAREKAQRAADWVRTPLDTSRPILAADTTVILEHDLLGKPADLDDARTMLARLSGSIHSVHTAIAVAYQDSLLEDVSITQVRFRALTPQDIDSYCASGEPMGKAGAYGIQGRAGMFVQHLSGSYTGVMGLPMFETARLLQSLP
ncbi:septum formation inhibitor Maf [Allopusillimonas soli]|uniref:dTTP/UTP pyrophosphatase n=1 Tax=Allopusillimonas soli TaxID=659016 RepID=A0A853FBW6_9BURK|nr:Maf family protein [Allopusillimonas soli]NYT37132.1 septum formation inhibitor Maf [Allopusillimonas soli]TEA75561.1 septum formation inhibitor Maf [Allopusillimonas soli]